MEKLLALSKVNKRFGGVVAAKDVDMEVYPGEIHGLIGPNGAGKTTMLNLISGITPVDSGTITFLGRNITKMKAHNRARMGLGRTFQTPRFLDRSDIEENILLANDLNERISFFKSFVSPKSKNFIPHLDELTRVADFSFYLEDDISSLTYGQRKMLEIIRSMITNPKLILVDEPAAGLNNVERDRVMTLLRLAAHERGIGIVLIEHSMDMIMDCCQNITVLNFGEVIACGSPQEVSNNEAVIEAYLGRRKDA
ncbi:MAG: ABC transporter ATP-binding protein [Clostridiaceae bacterium]|jgi:ABC-type branched-subunit amino acid transport system ATPase component|nr:ABC transporter ATP-binding protein [Clostridiaceae bacterium]